MNGYNKALLFDEEVMMLIITKVNKNDNPNNPNQPTNLKHINWVHDEDHTKNKIIIKKLIK